MATVADVTLKRNVRGLAFRNRAEFAAMIEYQVTVYRGDDQLVWTPVNNLACCLTARGRTKDARGSKHGEIRPAGERKSDRSADRQALNGVSALIFELRVAQRTKKNLARTDRGMKASVLVRFDGIAVVDVCADRGRLSIQTPLIGLSHHSKHAAPPPSRDFCADRQLKQQARADDQQPKS